MEINDAEAAEITQYLDIGAEAPIPRADLAIVFGTRLPIQRVSRRVGKFPKLPPAKLRYNTPKYY